MPRTSWGLPLLSRRNFSTMWISLMKHEAGGQFFTKDLTHGGEVAGGLGFKVEIGERPAHGFERVRGQVPGGVAGDASQGGDCVRGLGNFQERVNPARGGCWR